MKNQETKTWRIWATSPCCWLQLLPLAHSMPSLAAAAFAPVYYVMAGGVAWPMERSILAAICAMALLLAMRHRENISRLVAGKESRLGRKKA